MDITEHYTRAGDWKGHPNWACNHCPYSTTKEQRIRLHVAERHLGPGAPSPARRRSPILGPDGDQLIVEVDVTDAAADLAAATGLDTDTATDVLVAAVNAFADPGDTPNPTDQEVDDR